MIGSTFCFCKQRCKYKKFFLRGEDLMIENLHFSQLLPIFALLKKHYYEHSRIKIGTKCPIFRY